MPDNIPRGKLIHSGERSIKEKHTNGGNKLPKCGRTQMCLKAHCSVIYCIRPFSFI